MFIGTIFTHYKLWLVIISLYNEKYGGPEKGRIWNGIDDQINLGLGLLRLLGEEDSLDVG